MAALIGIVMAPGVMAHDSGAVFKPKETLAKLNKPRDSKSVFVQYLAPNIYPLSYAALKLLNLNRRIEFWDGCGQNLVLPGPDYANASILSKGRKWKLEIVWQWKWQDICVSPEMEFISRGVSVIDGNNFWFKTIASLAVLGHHSEEVDRNIRSALQFSDEFLTISNLSTCGNRCFHGLDIGSHRGRDTLHSASSARGLTDGCLHISSLACGNLVHFFDGLFQSLRLPPEYDKLEQSNQPNHASKSDHPPVGGRYILAICLFLGGFFLSLRGWEDLDDERKFRRTAYIGVGLLASAAGLLLWLTM